MQQNTVTCVTVDLDGAEEAGLAGAVPGCLSAPVSQPR